MSNSLEDFTNHVGDLGKELEVFAVSHGVKFEGSTSIHKRLMLAAWINMHGVESIRLDDGRLSHFYPPVIYYETGFNLGMSAVAACEAIGNCPGGGKVVSFELDTTKRVVAEKLISMYPDTLEVVWGNSNVTIRQHFDSSQDAPHIFFADGAHSYEGTLNELKVAWEILRPGGILILDDSLDPVARKARNAFRPPGDWIEANHQTGISFLQKGQPWS